jgi:hypothetical protein
MRFNGQGARNACRGEVTPKNGKKGHEELQPVQIDRPPVPKGMIALFSCSPKETSYEFPELGHAVFTHYLLDYLKESAAGGAVSEAGTASDGTGGVCDAGDGGLPRPQAGQDAVAATHRAGSV